MYVIHQHYTNGNKFINALKNHLVNHRGHWVILTGMTSWNACHSPSLMLASFYTFDWCIIGTSCYAWPSCQPMRNQCLLAVLCRAYEYAPLLTNIFHPLASLGWFLMLTPSALLHKLCKRGRDLTCGMAWLRLEGIIFLNEAVCQWSSFDMWNAGHMTYCHVTAESHCPNYTSQTPSDGWVSRHRILNQGKTRIYLHGP